ncbi:hypothetical protein QBC39DRAFT_377963 [Podospora conica]|nr:hypothetical protein QBC39DRAFT_377963 [Schizothecium conicum]
MHPLPALGASLPIQTVMALYHRISEVRNDENDELRTLCLVSFTSALYDIAPCILLPSMEPHYTNAYPTHLILIFATQVLGSLLGPGGLYLLSHLLLLAGNLIITLGAPWLPGLALAFVPIGFGVTINLALGNIICDRSASAFGLTHAAYAGGAIAGSIMAGLGYIPYFLLLVYVTLMSYGRIDRRFWDDNGLARKRFGNLRRCDGAVSRGVSQKTLLVGLFLLAYRAVEVALSGASVVPGIGLARWGDISGVMGDPEVPAPWYGDASGVRGGWLGFWLGMMVGRILDWVISEGSINHRGRVFRATGYVMGILVVLLLFPGVGERGGPVVSCAVGILMGQMYPSAMMVLVRNMSQPERVVAISFVSVMGNAGAEATPVIALIQTNILGRGVLRWFVLAMLAVMGGTWYALQDGPRRMKR